MTTTWWLVSALVASGGLQLLGQLLELSRQPVNPTARWAPPGQPPAVSTAFLTLQMPGILLMVFASQLLLPQLGWSWTLTLFLAALLTVPAPALWLERLAAETVAPFPRAGRATVGGLP